MVHQQTVKDFMSEPVLSVMPATSLQDAVQLLNDHHISGLPVVNDEGKLVGELSEQDLMVRESGVDAGPYVLLLDSVIYLRNPLNWDKQVHQVLGTSVNDLMRSETHSCKETLPLARAAALLHDRSTQRLFVIDDQRKPVGVITRGDIVRALSKQGE
ncbi:MAG: CBS domain-containing protein [Prochlorococcus sp.]|jgi:CBS domain-containing protein|nr:CBS domain-containing protein [Prochlorococcaceae cyanobacterium ETNP18_MAG_14]MDP6309483.1 CBS domain-containing protein [Prochlorococcaceae cyanobacterium ETNP14_MAG_4]HJM80509.1 CBS domain-containing protein [Prochlorococcaceae cyanobacterium Fu_MAG_72]|tara:strand:+ start:12533 stop:13003 length:471 start_codon:yes stop_codon:yes gene_type:complete